MDRQRRAVFFDRDGVLNEAIVRDGKPYPPQSLDQVRLVPGAKPNCSKLKAKGFMLLVVTNQPDIARGSANLEAVATINNYLAEQLPVDEILVCPHDDRDGCDCRKPKPGLLVRAANKYGIHLERSFLIGDRWRDVDAGRAAGCRTVWIDYNYREHSAADRADKVVSSLADAVDWILTLEEPVSE